MKKNKNTWFQAFYAVVFRIPFFIMVMVPISYFGIFNIGAYFCGKTEAVAIIGKNNGKGQLTLMSNANDTIIFTTYDSYKYNIGGTLYLKTVTFNYPFHYYKKRILPTSDSTSGFYGILCVILCCIYIVFEPILEILAKKITEKIKNGKSL